MRVSEIKIKIARITSRIEAILSEIIKKSPFASSIRARIRIRLGEMILKKAKSQNKTAVKISKMPRILTIMFYA